MKQSPNDKKQYQTLTLTNGLRVLLVQNAETNKAAAALAVNVGHFSDPEDRQGMAHFLEHMLFLGTTKYPDGSEYQKFISQNGGSNNAWTATEHTCFFFDIHHQHFEAALDRFSQFFISPLLSEDFVNKERKNIDAEFKLKLKDDIRRLYDVHKETINPTHPFSKFSVGNTETLADKENRSLRDEVEAFFIKHYVAKAMTLVLEGPQSLEDLEQFAVRFFDAISDKSISATLPDEPLYLPQHQGVKILVNPVKDDKQLIISFALPSFDKFYQQKPESLLAYLIGHEGKNGVLSTLKEKQWALSLTAGSGVHGYNFKDFNISIRLTELGEQHIEDIISVVFAYIHLLKNSPLEPHFYAEKKAMAELSFHYHEKVKPLDSVCQLVINMQHYQEEDYIFGDYVMTHMSQTLFDEVLSYFTPDNFRYVHVSKTIETTETSRWYQVPFQVLPIANSQMTTWSEQSEQFNLKLPCPNQYIVANPVVFEDQADAPATPQLITEKTGITVWYKQDQTFKVPKGYIYIGIDSPVTLESPENIAMTRLFVDLYGESVIEQHYDAELAGIHYHLYAHQGGLTLQLSGLSEKQALLLEQLLTELQKFSFKECQFELMKKQLINHWRNTDTSKSISQLFSALSSTMQPKNPAADTLRKVLEPITYDSFRQYCQSIFKQVNLEVLIHGNWRLQDAQAIEQTITKAFDNQLRQKSKDEIPLLDLAGQGHVPYPLELPSHDHAAVIYYSVASKDLDQIALTMVTSQILSPQFFQQMRTERQYGYLVGVGFVPINRYPGLAFYIQSPNFPASELIDAMNEFINDAHKLLDVMSDDEWHHLQHGLASQLQEKDTSLRIKSQRFWNAICNQEFEFNQKKRLIAALLKLTRDDIQAFLWEKFSEHTGVKDRVCLMSLKHVSDAEKEKLQTFLKNCSIKY